ncbi:MAG TPA: porin [Alphaproteobacteria bacterium]|nr:porin [Alphaproteobacteria bacterium]
MRRKTSRGPRLAMTAAAATALLGWSGAVLAQGSGDSDVQRQIKVLEQQLQDLKQQVEENKAKAEEASAASHAEDNADLKWHLGGFTSVDYSAGDQNGDHNSFGAGHFNPIFLVDYKDLVSFEGELEIATTTDGDTETMLEFANTNLFATDWLTFTAGKFLSPIGDFQQHQHPSWINKLPDRPAGFVEDGGTEPLSEVGVMARGAVPVGDMTATYALYVGNGPRMADNADGGVSLEGFGGDDNRSKAWGGRLGLHPLPYVTVGVSGMASRIRGNEGSGGDVSSADYRLEDVDAAFTRGAWDVRGEYIHASLDSLQSALSPTTAPVTIPSSSWRAWFAQAAYRLSGLTSDPILGNVEPVVRYSQFHVSGLDDFKTTAEDRWTLGVNYWFAPSLVAKAAVEQRDFHNQSDEDLVRLQLAFGF